MSAAIHSPIPCHIAHRANSVPVRRFDQAQYDQMETQETKPTELPTGFVTVGQALASAFSQLEKEWAEAAKAREQSE